MQTFLVLSNECFFIDQCKYEMFSVRTNVTNENVKCLCIFYTEILDVSYSNIRYLHVICPNLCVEQKYDVLCPILCYM